MNANKKTSIMKCQNDRYSEVRKHLHIVSCGDSINGLGVIRSLGEMGIDPIVLCLQSRRHMLTHSRYVHNLILIKEGENPIDVLIQRYGNENLKPFVYTSDDWQVSMINSRYDELKDKFYCFNCGENGELNKYLNKAAICSVAEKCGFRIPTEEVVKTGDLPKRLKYPIITKTLSSLMGKWKLDSYVCENETELVEAYSNIQSPELLLQEYVYKKNELAIQGFSIDGGNQVYLPFQLSYFRLPKNGYGRYMYFTPVTDNTLIEKISNIMKQCHYSGCFEIEFLIDQNNELIFLEVNFRYSAWNYAVTFGGINYPLEWAKATLEGVVDIPDTRKQYFTAMEETGDFGHCVSSGQMSFSRWMKDVHASDMCYGYNPHDKWPAYFMWYNKILKAIRKKLHLKEA